MEHVLKSKYHTSWLDQTNLTETQRKWIKTHCDRVAKFDDPEYLSRFGQEEKMHAEMMLITYIRALDWTNVFEKVRKNWEETPKWEKEACRQADERMKELRFK